MKRIALYTTAMCMLLSLIGCGKKSALAAKVSGALTYKGQPIKAGVMQFVTNDGTSFPAKIFSDGTYEAIDLPNGEMVVTVETESLKPAVTQSANSEKYKKAMSGQKAPAGRGGEAAGNPADNYVKIPAKYKNPKTTSLTTTLSSGRQVVNFDLTD